MPTNVVLFARSYLCAEVVPGGRPFTQLASYQGCYILFSILVGSFSLRFVGTRAHHLSFPFETRCTSQATRKLPPGWNVAPVSLRCGNNFLGDFVAAAMDKCWSLKKCPKKDSETNGGFKKVLEETQSAPLIAVTLATCQISAKPCDLKFQNVNLTVIASLMQ